MIKSIIYHIILSFLYLNSLPILMPNKLYSSTSISPFLVPVTYVLITRLCSKIDTKYDLNFIDTSMFNKIGNVFAILVFILVVLYYAAFAL